MCFDHLIIHDIELNLLVIMRKQLDLSHKTQLCLNLNLNKEIDASNEEIICFLKKDQKVTLDKELTLSL